MKQSTDPRPGDVVNHDACKREFTVLFRGVMLDSSVQVVVIQAASGAVSVVKYDEWITPVAGRPRFLVKEAAHVPG